jgi:hypothetical protein
VEFQETEVSEGRREFEHKTGTARRGRVQEDRKS